MSYYNDFTFITSDIQIDGVSMPMVTNINDLIVNNTISNFDRLADTGDGIGKIINTKKTIVLHYDRLNKEHFDKLYNATQYKVEHNKQFEFFITIDTHTSEGVQTFKCYPQSQFSVNCVETTDVIYFKTGDVRYKRGGSLYDCLYKDITFSFVQL